MAQIREMNEDWDAWLAERPQVIQDLAKRLPPNLLYRMRGKHRVTLYSYEEDGTLSVHVSGQYNRVLFSRHVFGVLPDDLVECDLPGPDEDLGDSAEEAGYSDQDIKDVLIPRLKDEMDSQ